MAIHCSDELRKWLEQVTGATVIRAEQPTAGASREAWIVDCQQGDAVLKLFCLRDKQGNCSAKDAAILKALGHQPVPVPEVIAEDADKGLILLSRIEGDNALDESCADEVGAHLMQVCADLHSIPVDECDIPHLKAPPSQRAGIEQQLKQIEQAIAAMGDSAHPLFLAGLRYLQQHMPDSKAPLSLVHSDMGPGNFLHNGKQVLAVLDWEVAHFGDAMEDLATLAVRDMATPIGALEQRFSEYSHAIQAKTDSKISLDSPRIAYFRLLILIRNSALITLGLTYPPADFDHLDMVRYQALLMRGAALCLCECLGIAQPDLSELSDKPAGQEQAHSVSEGMQRQLEQLADATEGLAKRQAKDLKAALLDVMANLPGSRTAKASAMIDAEFLRAIQSNETVQALSAVQWEQLAISLCFHTQQQCRARKHLMGELFERLPQPIPNHTAPRQETRR